MSRVIRVTRDVLGALARRPEESWNDAVRRLLGLPALKRMGRRKVILVTCSRCFRKDEVDVMLLCEVCDVWLCAGACSDPHIDQSAASHEEVR